MGKNIKQLPTRTTPLLTDFVYAVGGSTDYNLTLDKIKILFGIEDLDQWQSGSVAHGTTDYLNLIDSTIYGAVKIEYIAKRGARGYRTGVLTLMVDDSAANGVSISDNWETTRFDGDDLGINLDDGSISAGIVQLAIVTDSSDTNDTILNYKIISKRPITVS